MSKKSMQKLAIGSVEDMNLAIYLKNLESRVSYLEKNNKTMLKLLVTLKRMLDLIAKGKAKK